MNGTCADDHAVVVGISRYPRMVADGVAADLRGPDNDALAVRDWLVDEAGGRLPPGNVTLIRSADCAANPDQPASQRVLQAFDELEERTRERSGRRLYLYFAGHGFSPELEEAAVFTAESTHVRPSYVYAHQWLRWFRRAQRFEQSVLWVDACMNHQQSIPVQEIGMRPQVGRAVPGPAFIALAAQTKSALELPMADGAVHGVFTWTLLRGLRGGAADRRGRVTGRSLQGFLHNAMADFLPPEARRAASVDLQPFVRADEGLDFVRVESRPVHPVVLTAPAARAGQALRVWTGSPHRLVVQARLEGPQWRGDLARGLYVAEVPGAGLRQGFQVTGATDVRVGVDETGPPVRTAGEGHLFRLEVAAANPAASVVLVDHEFQHLFTDTGRLVDREAPGVYKVRTQFGRDVTTASERIVLLDDDLVLGADAPVPLLVGAPPASGSASAGAVRERLLAGVAAPRRSVARISALAVVSRCWGRAPAPAGTPLPHPMAGLRLLTLDGALLADLARDAHLDGGDGVDGDGGPVAVWERRLEPGTYLLRQELPRGVFEGSVVVSPQWVTQVVVRRTTGLGGPWGAVPRRPGAAAEPDDVALFMRRTAGTTTARDDVVEAARTALTQGRHVFAGGRGAALLHALLEEHDDPVAAIIGCHLLLLPDGGSGGAARGGEVLDRAVRRLRDLVGGQHPDVEALSLRCADPSLRTHGPFPAPPMFAAGWRLLVAASYDDPALLPAHVWARVHSSTRIGPFFVWAADEERRAAHAQQLREWIDSCAEPTGGSTAPAARGGAAPPPTALRTPAPTRSPRPPRPSRSNAPPPPSRQAPPSVLEAARRVGIPATAAVELWGARGASAR
ncbi:caspase family protein [Kineococcus indalonis]|uniref:caspase family protein n=1 Tax=Kineococcus indalonis TaxID=2696566 RepID=UPI0014133333|nr:caspase family protein [Kineococcus indalonis]NAZ86527.1 hypothetical protein [Kineococcus indalonis]